MKYLDAVLHIVADERVFYPKPTQWSPPWGVLGLLVFRPVSKTSRTPGGTIQIRELI